MDIERIKSGLSDCALFHGIEHHNSIGSTNDRALALMGLQIPEGFLVTADSQSAGRGRLSRRWSDEPECSLLVSMVLRPQCPADRWPLIGLAVAIATARAAEALSGAAVRVKWPNDVVVEGAERLAKLAGVLVEGQNNGLVAGVGVNVRSAPRSLSEGTLPPVSITELGAPGVTREDLLVRMVREFGVLYGALEGGQFGAITDAFSELDITRGRAVTLTGPRSTVAGTAEGVDAAGRLLVRTRDALEGCAVGDLTVRLGDNDQFAD